MTQRIEENGVMISTNMISLEGKGVTLYPRSVFCRGRRSNHHKNYNANFVYIAIMEFSCIFFSFLL